MPVQVVFEIADRDRPSAEIGYRAVNPGFVVNAGGIVPDERTFPDVVVEIGSEVVLVGKQGDLELSMEEVSEAAHSFNYELPCRVAERVPRVYYKNGEIVKIVKNI
jgi:hypothetical protein